MSNPEIDMGLQLRQPLESLPPLEDEGCLDPGIDVGLQLPQLMSTQQNPPAPPAAGGTGRWTDPSPPETNN